jgi:YfdX protein
VGNKDYPGARVLLAGLISEIRIRIYNIPLATYPIALRDAAKLLDEKKTDEAKAVVQLALNTLAIVDHVEPLPIVTAQAAIEEAQTQRDKDKEAAKKQLAVAKQELDRAKELGYAGNDPEYSALASGISDIEKQLNGGQDSTSAFARLKDRVASFFKRVTSSEKRSEVASR